MIIAYCKRNFSKNWNGTFAQRMRLLLALEVVALKWLFKIKNIQIMWVSTIATTSTAAAAQRSCKLVWKRYSCSYALMDLFPPLKRYFFFLFYIKMIWLFKVSLEIHWSHATWQNEWAHFSFPQRKESIVNAHFNGFYGIPLI